MRASTECAQAWPRWMSSAFCTRPDVPGAPGRTSLVSTRTSPHGTRRSARERWRSAVERGESHPGTYCARAAEPRGPGRGGRRAAPPPRDGPVVSGAWFLRVETSRSLLLSCLFAVPLSLSSVLSTVRLKQEPVLNVQLDRSVSVELCNRSALVGDWDRIERGTFVRGAAHRRHAHHPHIEDDLCV
jgi:hypothetical protein